MSTTERGLVKQEAFDGATVKRSAETAQAAAAEQSRAVVQARFLMAVNRPRNYDDARLAILKTCQRPTFAAKARYKKPQFGAKACGRMNCPQKKREFNKSFLCDCICGLSIRAADEFAKFYGNIQTEQMTMYDDDDQRIIGVAATDLEHNITKSVTITIRKTIERKDPKDRAVISWRENSKGEKVAVLQATDDEVLQKEGALCAKARRNLLLQLIPADLLEEAEDAAFATSINDDAEDPDSKKKKLIGLFDAIGVKPSEIEKYLGHSLDNIPPAELADLRSVYMAINEGDAKWADFIKAAEGDDEKANAKADSVKAKMQEKLAAKQKKDKPAQTLGEDGTLKESFASDFAKARIKLSLLFEERGAEIDEQLLMNGLDMSLIDIPADCADERIMRAVIKIAAGF